MTMQEIRQAHHAEPFHPFTIRMADGRILRVPHPDFLLTPPTGRTIVVHMPDDSHAIIDLMLVAELEFKANGSSKRR